MKSIIYLVFLFSIGLSAQTVKELSETISKLDNALVKKDTAMLDLILHKKVSITHSNGFTEEKYKMKENTISSFIKYTQIKQKSDAEFIRINDNSYIVYRFIHVEGIYDIYDYEMDLRLMEVWILENKRWQLLGRQSLEIKQNK